MGFWVFLTKREPKPHAHYPWSHLVITGWAEPALVLCKAADIQGGHDALAVVGSIAGAVAQHYVVVLLAREWAGVGRGRTHIRRACRMVWRVVGGRGSMGRRVEYRGLAW